MNRDEFIDIIEGIENEPFIIVCNGKESSPLIFVKALSDSVKVMSNGRPAIYKYESIESLSFDIDSLDKGAVIKKEASTEYYDNKITMVPFLEEIKRHIWIYDFSYVDRQNTIKNEVRNTLLEKELVRVQNMLLTAEKNHTLNEKSEEVISNLEALCDNYPCIEIYQMIANVFVSMNDFANASLYYEIACDYQNAAHFAAKSGNRSAEYQIEVLRKWILSGNDYDKAVFSSFFSLAHFLHKGRLCAETIKQLDLEKQSEEIKEIIFYGLALVLSDYFSEDKLHIIIEEKNKAIINELIIQLLNETVSEAYEPEPIRSLPHVSALLSDNSETNWEQNLHIGYIINPSDEFHGFIGKEITDKKGLYFSCSYLLGELASCYPEYYPYMRGLKVAYNIEKKEHKNKLQDVATNVQLVDENLEAFFKTKNIHYTSSTKDPDKTSEEMLSKNNDGISYSGYIIKVCGTFGFINQDANETTGVYFSVSELSDNLKGLNDIIVGLKVRLELGEEDYTNPRRRKAVKITEDEDLQAFINRKSLPQPEVVDETVVVRELSNRTPAAAVQYFATHNKPLHALDALEKSKDSFSYDKYVKHKIQLLQRTKSSDSELISLLSYTITTSRDSSYIAHNLYFLGQVQYRCKQYSDVISTLNQLMRYRKYMKSQTQYTDAIYLIAVSYYMLRDYTNSDQLAKELRKFGVHEDEVSKLLDRTFASEIDISDTSDEDYFEEPLQFDTEVAITPFIEMMIDHFSFSSVSLREFPSNFNLLSDNCSIKDADYYISRLRKYNSRDDQQNKPNACIAIAKLQKWLIGQVVEEKKKEEIEISLRDYVSRALQIIARNEIQKTNEDIRVYLFYRMQQYRMSVTNQKPLSYNAYINAHFTNTLDNKSLKSLIIKSEPRQKDYILFISDIMLFIEYMDFMNTDSERLLISKTCNGIISNDNTSKYRGALCNILESLDCAFKDEDSFSALLERGSKGINQWMKLFKKDIRNKAQYRQLDELLIDIEKREKYIFLTEHEKDFISEIKEAVAYMNESKNNTKTAMKQNLLNQSLNTLDELTETLENSPTYILYTIFADVLGILKNTSLTMLGEVMSHKPTIEPVGSQQINVGLTLRREFLLPLEFENRAPSVQAKNFTITVEKMSEGVSFLSLPPNGQNVDEGERYSQSLKFRLDANDIRQVSVSIKVDYSYDTFDNIEQKNERQSQSLTFTYTVSFQEVEKIVNRYQQYAQQQTVTDEKMFFGRDLLIRRLYDAVCIKNENNNDVLKGGSGIVLYGQRRSGKTSILYHLGKKISRDIRHSIVVDLGSSGKQISNEQNNTLNDEVKLQERNKTMTLSAMYHLIINGIKDYIEENCDDNRELSVLQQSIAQYELKNNEKIFPDISVFAKIENPQLLFNDFLRHFAKVAKPYDLQNGFRVVVMMDEFTYFNEAIEQNHLPKNFMEIWKGVVSDSFITLIVAGQDNMVEFIDKYVNEFSSFNREWVSFLGKEASLEMIMTPIGKDRIYLDAAEKLYRFTAGSPYLLMDVCAKLVDWMNENKILKLSGSLPDDFLLGRYMRAYEFKEDLIEPQYKDAGKLDWTSQIKMVLGLIARSTSRQVSINYIPWDEFDQYALIKDEMLMDSGIEPGRMQEILKRLVKRQVIETQEGYQSRYRIKIPLCREWILRRGGSEYGNE